MRTRTSNLLIRSQVLYPIELWALELAARVASAGRARAACRRPAGATAPVRHDAHDRTRTCTPFLALVPQTSLYTNFSTWAVRDRCSEGDLNPHEVSPTGS